MASMYAPPAPPRRRARWPWVLLGVVLVLVALFVAADRIALHIAEDKAAETLQSSQQLNTKPDVSVAGFPFLTQLVAGEFDDVTISANDLDVGNHTVQIASLVVHLHHVTVPRDYSQVRARTAQADARIGYDELSRALHVPVSDAGGGRLAAKATVTLNGQTFSGTVSAVPRTSSKGISFADPKVTVGSVNLPAFAARALANVFSKVISLAGLPFNVQVTGAGVTTDGLVAHLAGHDLVYSRS
jgi:hypothetical protein